MNFAYRSYQKELLDRDDIPFEDIKQNMRELNQINNFLGGHRTSLHGIKKLVNSGNPQIAVCEIGCGGGDNLFVLKKWFDHKKSDAIFCGIDINPHCIAFAKSQQRNEGFVFINDDYRLYRFPKKPDIIFSSLFCHHFNEWELVNMLKWMQQNAASGFFINDLHRHCFAYFSIKWLTKIFSKSYLVKNDAPLSVLRGFSKKEWRDILAKAGIDHYYLRWKWAFRWLIVVKNKNSWI